MKKIIFLSILLAMQCVFVFSQISITGADLPKPGRVNLLAHDTLSQPNIGIASSTAQTWDFTAINSNYPQVTSYSPTTPYHQYASVFPDANMYSYGPSLLYGALSGAAPLDYTNFGYMYLESENNGLNIIGYVSQYGITHQVPKDKILITPAQMNDSFNDSSYWQVQFALVPTDVDTIYRSRVKKTVTVDAFGTLTTVLGTFDVLRIHEYFIKVDSVFGSLNGNIVFGMEVIRDTVNNYHFWANDINYPVAIVQTRTNQTVKTTEILVDTVPTYQITGNVFNTDSSAAITAGKVQLIPKNPVDNLFGVQEIVNIDNNGHFQFSNVLEYGQFLVIAIADSVQYPDIIPTYYGDTIYWQDALIMQASSDTNITIYMQNNTYWQNYPGQGNTITGIVWQNLNGSKGPGNSTPSRGIRVTLEKNPAGEIIRHTETNSDGRYTFEDLPDFEYTIVVDIPGLDMDSTYHFDLTSESGEHYAGYDFVYDSLKIYIYDATFINPLAVALPTIELNIYPNPFSRFATIQFNNPNAYLLKYTLKVYDLTGREVDLYEGTTTQSFTINSENLKNGIYFYEITVNDKMKRTGKLVVKK